MGIRNVLALFAVLAIVGFSGALTAQVLDEGFESTPWPWSPWVSQAGGGTLVTSPVHSGSQSLLNPGWHYRTDVTVGNAGDKLEGWAYPGGSGRFYMGFAASAAGCFSLLLAPNTSNLVVQQNSGFGYLDVAATPFTYTLNQWYKLEVEFVSSTSITGRLYDSTGTTVLATVNYTAASSLVGGVAIRSFSNVYIDDMKTITGPNLTVSATLGTPQPVLSNAQGPGNAGVEAGSFEIISNNLPGALFTELELTASGTGNDAVDLTEVSLYRDDTSGTNPNAYDAADILVAGPEVFAADDGSINFTILTAEQDFPVSTTRQYFVVVKLGGTALPPQTFEFTVTDITTPSGVNKNVPAGSTMAGLVVEAAEFAFTDHSPANPEKVFLTFAEVCQVFDIAYAAGPDDKPASITVNSLGTADEATDVAAVELWWDSDTSGSFNDAQDTLVDSQVFTQDDGIAVFSMASQADFQAGQTRRYFVVYRLNANAGDLETFRCYISDVGAAPLGGAATGLPLPSANGTPGLEVSAAILFGVMNGPLAPVSVSSNAQGPTGDGVLIADVTLDALPGGDWVVNTITFHAGGTGSHNTAYMELGLYEDSGNNTWDGAATDALAAPVQATFDANSVTFALSNPSLAAGAQRRFYLTGKLNGTAAAGETFNARLQSVSAIPPPGGSTSDFPTPASTAVIIDTPVLSVANGPNQPSPATHAAGSTGSLVAAQFRLNALNGATVVNGINFTTSGTGDWSSDVASVSVHHDNGDGIFNDADDTVLDIQPGGALITTSFALSLAVGEIADLWVVIHFTATAGDGVSATPETFSLAIANVTDVQAGAPVDFGSPQPQGITVGAIDFSVTTIEPTTGLASGGGGLTIQGSGFMTPFSVTIGGTLCPGTANVTGTQVTGLTIPAGFGENLPIVVRSGTLPPQTLTQTFTYTSPKDSAPPKAEDSTGCSTGAGSVWAILLAALGVLAIAGRRRIA